MCPETQKPVCCEKKKTTLLDYLNSTPFDELVEFDLVNRELHTLRHVEGKYFVPVLDCSLDAMYNFSLENMVHPEDRSMLSKLMNPETIITRLEHSSTPGMVSAEIRFKLLNGEWNWSREILVAGEGTGLPDNVVRGYIYDIQAIKSQETRYSASDIHRDERTGLLLDRDIYILAREKMSKMTGEWCVIAIDIEHFRLFLDWHGSTETEILLAEIGKILRRIETDTDGLAGYRGADAFWLVVPYSQRLVSRLYEELRNLIVSHGNSIGFLPAFGICKIDDPNAEVTDFFNHASVSAERVKGNLHNRILQYDPYDQTKETDIYRLLTDFQKGLSNREVFLYCSPSITRSQERSSGRNPSPAGAGLTEIWWRR